MNIGVLFCAYNCAETVVESLDAWKRARQEFLDGHKFIISAVSVPFKEYSGINILVDNTTEYLMDRLDKNEIDSLIIDPKYISEAEARNLALKPLLSEQVDYIILWDGDEIATLDQILAILKFIEDDPFCVWYSISYKNYVFNDRTFLKTPFTPPRVFKRKSSGFLIDCFSWDNDILYKEENGTSVYKDYRSLPSKNISKNIAWVKHLTWLNNEKTKAKIDYQLKHFGHCSYRWDDVKKSIEINPDFYNRRGLPIPEIQYE